MSIQRFGTTPRYSDSVVHAGTVYLVEVPATDSGDIATQTQSLLAGVDRLLAQAGSDKSATADGDGLSRRSGGL